ncbi:uncharacterized protein LOC126800258 [Argentina anserina]|uniref:uncharacterized protein LOC126800258 n=1 Tax=Argentina anserina TaxID=57926 RepID=UPI00217661CF|nr:uncharacterized protein LOC126800258 [Potentilla anserina]
MSAMHHRSRLAGAAAPPSPIPTAKGSRSAASETFSQFLDNCLKIPELIALPPSRLPSIGPRQIADVDFRSLSADSIASLLVSAKQLGAFRIIGHGITADQVSSVVQEAESVFGNADRQSRHFIERVGSHEVIAWVRDQKKKSDLRYDSFCNNMEKVASKIGTIAEQLSQVFYKNPKVEFVRRTEEKDWVFRLYRCKHDQDTIEQNHSNSRNEIDCARESDDHGLCIHFPLEHSQFYIQSERGPLTFDAGPEMLVVTIGKQLEGFKCVSGEMICEPDIRTSEASFSLQLKVPFSSNFRKDSKRISIADQVFIALFLCLLYKVVVFGYTYVTTT